MAGIYKVTAPSKMDGMEFVSWASSDAAAKGARADFCSVHELKPKQCGIEKIEVPTKKDELIAWLNANVKVLPKG